VYFPDRGVADCPVFDRYALSPGVIMRGPAVVEERESTTVVPPRSRLRVDRDLNLVIGLAGAVRP
jgi:5-oxoprolinase (ATP-hydrolysing)/N-methylhydantoinase A